MGNWSWLMRLAAAVWLAWIGLIGLMFGMLRLGAWHPHFLPVTAVLVVLLAAGLSLLILGIWRLLRGPRRLHALGCLLLGLPPLGFLAGHLMYGFGTAYGRQLTISLPLKVLVPFGESILDLVARFQYPERTEGERLVMISTPVESARSQVAAMDRHIRALEARLGRTGTRRVHWVRGPLLGLQGKAILGMCMGSLPGGGWERPDAEGLTTLDRHEVAHVVLSQFCTTAFEPPAVLMEGWAEVASMADPNPYRLRAWAAREAGRTLSLEELIGPRWYGRHDQPAYTQGAPLVDYILRQFGPERFVELYATCQPATIAGDCRRILGVSIDQLDEACWADLEKHNGPGGYHGLWLASLQLGPGVDHAEWERFTSEYLAAAGRLLAPYEHVRLTAERVHTSEDAKGQTSSFPWQYEFKRSDSLRAIRFLNKNGEEVYLAHPEHSFCAERKAPAEAWEIHEDPSVKPELAYRRIVREIDLMQPVYHDTVPLFSLADFATTLVNPLSLKVSRLERFSENGRRFIRIEFEDCPPGHPIYRKLTLQVSADDYSAVHDESVNKAGWPWVGDTIYESHEGVPLLQSTRSEGQSDDGSHATNVLTVVDRRFEPIPEDEFTQERLLGEAPVKRVVPKPDTEEVSGLLSWYPLPLVLSALSLAAGACLLQRTRGRGNASG
jgi:hypothetical protein